MKNGIIIAVSAAILSLTSAGGALAAKVSRDAAVKQCIAQAQKVSTATAVNDEDPARVRAYATCMRSLGYRP